MARYTTQRRTRSWIEDEDAWDYPTWEHVPSVIDHEPVDTGLLDADGSTIWRLPNPIGFGRDDEW